MTTLKKQKLYYSPGTIALTANQTDSVISKIPTNGFYNDLYVSKIIVSINDRAGSGNTITGEVTEGTSTMAVALTGNTTAGSSTTNAFDLDADTETLTFQYDSTLSIGDAKLINITIEYYFK